MFLKVNEAISLAVELDAQTRICKEGVFKINRGGKGEDYVVQCYNGKWVRLHKNILK
jgi:hypothetical protein